MPDQPISPGFLVWQGGAEPGRRFPLSQGVITIGRAKDGTKVAETAGTAFSVWREARQVASGTLGANEVFQLPAGDYTLRLASEPPRQFSFRMGAEESVALALTREGDRVFTRESRQPTDYYLCE